MSQEPTGKAEQSMEQEDLAQRMSVALGLSISDARALIKYSISLHAKPPGDETLDVGATRSGGWPDLPASFTWPRNGDRPLAHCIQINLADLPPTTGLPLPETGLLSFFYDPEDLLGGEWPVGINNCRVAWFPDVDALTRHAFPDDLDADYRWDPIGFDLEVILSVPAPEALDYQGIRYDRDEEPNYFEIREALDVSYSDHRIGGWWSHGQNDPRVDAEAASRASSETEYYDIAKKIAGHPETFSDWHLLFQLQSIETLDGRYISIGDGDHACFMMRYEDLLAREFSRARAFWVF